MWGGRRAAHRFLFAGLVGKNVYFAEAFVPESGFAHRVNSRHHKGIRLAGCKRRVGVGIKIGVARYVSFKKSGICRRADFILIVIVGTV